jgi:SGNH domain (fused to AT3 domains)
MSFAGVGLIVASIAVINVDLRYPGWWAVMPTMGAVFIIAAGAGSWCNRHLLSNRIAVWFGLISYPLYLWHWPLLAFLRIIDPVSTESELRLARLAVIVVSIILAWATYRLLEIRVRKSKPPAFVAGLVTTMAAVCGVAVLTGLAESQSDQTRAGEFYWAWARTQTSDCIAKYGLRPSKNLFCVETNPDIAPSVLVIGDSHANHWVPGIKAQDGRGILNIGEGGCPFFERVHVESHSGYAKDCERTMTRAFEVLQNSPSITSVVLSTRAATFIPGPAYGNIDPKPLVTFHLAGFSFMRHRARRVWAARRTGALAALVQNRAPSDIRSPAARAGRRATARPFRRKRRLRAASIAASQITAEPAALQQK